MLLKINGEIWTIQYVNLPLPQGYEIIAAARLIRVQFNEYPEVFGNRVAEAVASLVLIPVIPIPALAD